MEVKQEKTDDPKETIGEKEVKESEEVTAAAAILDAAEPIKQEVEEEEHSDDEFKPLRKRFKPGEKPTVLEQIDLNYDPPIVGPKTALQCLSDRRRLAEYHEVMRANGPERCLEYNFVSPSVPPVVLNVVSAAGIGMQLDLKKIITLCKNVEYNPRRFAPCVMRIRKPRSTCLIFSSGRMIVSGCKSEADSYIAVRRFVRILQTRVEPTIQHLKSYEIQNMSASCTLPFGILLPKMAACVAKDCGQFYSYEPELFPGMVWRLTEPKARIVLFSGGAILFTGLKSEEQLHKAFQLIYPLCRFCRR